MGTALTFADWAGLVTGKTECSREGGEVAERSACGVGEVTEPDFGRRWHGPVVLERLLPGAERLQQGRKFKTVMLFRKNGKVSRCPPEQGSTSRNISARMVMECDRNLNESLEEFAILRRGGTPHIFQDLVCQKVLAGVKELNAFATAGRGRARCGGKHRCILHAQR